MKHGMLIYSLFMGILTTALLVCLFFTHIQWDMEKFFLCGILVSLGYFCSYLSLWFHLESKKDARDRNYRNKILSMLEEEDFK